MHTRTSLKRVHLHPDNRKMPTECPLHTRSPRTSSSRYPALVSWSFTHSYAGPQDHLTDNLGLEYFHYRRALFLAGQEPYSLPHPLPAYIMVPRPPPPLPLPSSSGGTKPSATAKLEKMLEGPGAQDNMMMRRKVAEVERVMKAGRKLVKGTSLSLVVSSAGSLQQRLG